VQIGSDTQLVAPVTVGADSYVAAGSTISRDVTPGSLAFNEKPQRERGGWVAAFRARTAAKKASANPPKKAAAAATKTKPARGAAKAPASTKKPSRGAAKAAAPVAKKPARRAAKVATPAPTKKPTPAPKRKRR